MKLYHIALLLIKIFISVQLVLIFFKLESPTHRVFVITDAIFNFYVGADNIANELPPYGLPGVGGGSAIYNNTGRFFYAGVVAKF